MNRPWLQRQAIAHPGRVFQVLATLTVGLLSACPAAQQAGAPTFDEPFFAAPWSGQKVTSYEVTLRSHGGDRAFELPRDCAVINSLLTSGKTDRSRVIDRRLWMKVEHDCRYYALLRRHPRHDLADHVSAYDFGNLALDILPYDPGCVGNMSGQHCSPLIVDASGDRRRFPLVVQPGRRADAVVGSTPCRLVDGVFHGRILPHATGLHCVPDERASLRLVGVDYGDVNGDGVLDAVLRLMPLSPEGGRRLLRIAVTRFAPDGRFEAPPLPGDAQN